jgi:hypothetical protein
MYETSDVGARIVLSIDHRIEVDSAFDVVEDVRPGERG